jgi:nucleoid DNA-binding protein
MELRVQLKVCEGCGSLWYRAQNIGSVYCKQCEVKLKDFPSPESRKRRGRPSRKPQTPVWAVIEATGGAE